MKKSIKFFLSDKQGLAFIEFALFLPLMIVMIFGVVEFTRYLTFSQKVNRSSYVLSNITNQFLPRKSVTIKETEISASNLDSLVFPQFARSMDFNSGDPDRIAIISSITKTDTGNSNNKIVINWQRVGGGTLVSNKAVSLLNGVNAKNINSLDDNGATAGTHPTFPSYSAQLMNGALSNMQVGENMIITEVFYEYKPLLKSLKTGLTSVSMLPQGIMKSVTFSRPRNGDLDDLKPPQDTGTGGGGDIVTNSCSVVAITVVKDPSKCTLVGYVLENGFCKKVQDCYVCTGKNICKTCTTPVDGPTSCAVTSADPTGCGNQLFKDNVDMSFCTGGGPINPPPPPPPSSGVPPS